MNKMGQVVQMMNQVRSASNPNAMLQMLAQTNPVVQQAMTYVNQNGGNAQQAFYNLAQQKGVDPMAVLNQLK